MGRGNIVEKHRRERKHRHRTLHATQCQPEGTGREGKKLVKNLPIAFGFTFFANEKPHASRCPDYAPNLK
jgi:hypothetical protein